MRIKTRCSVCEGTGKRLDQPCIGCRGYGFVFVGHEPELESPAQNRKRLHIRASRVKLLDRLLNAIREHQREYLEKMDVMKLRPMILKDIADAAGCKIPTASVRLRNQFINGLPVRSLFSESISGVSNKVVMEMIRSIINQNPTSDTDIMNILGRNGIKIARRTVTKYRNSINLPPVYKHDTKAKS